MGLISTEEVPTDTDDILTDTSGGATDRPPDTSIGLIRTSIRMVDIGSLEQMEQFVKHGIQIWTKKLEKVEKIDLSHYGMASSMTLRGLSVDRAFMDTCLHLWDPLAYVLLFGMHFEEMCLTYEDFAALLGSDSKRALVATSTKFEFFRTFMRMLGMSMGEDRESVVDDQVNLYLLIKRLVGWGDLIVADLVLEMEWGAGIARMALA
ncbi:hypothetical protein JCGZ_18557 [Jatropha curcas]|uniref:Uncharacterized protein n=1 Tax=Jatropha curcas TaxID=180498 RepID=A0A067K1R4_JATCU|nr:hypothetical protein JCGZ_18557 [Jatropha curcas]